MHVWWPCRRIIFSALRWLFRTNAEALLGGRPRDCPSESARSARSELGLSASWRVIGIHCSWVFIYPLQDSISNFMTVVSWHARTVQFIFVIHVVYRQLPRCLLRGSQPLQVPKSVKTGTVSPSSRGEELTVWGDRQKISKQTGQLNNLW